MTTEAMKAAAPVSMEELVRAINFSTRQVTVCVPDREYYRRAGDWSEETIRFIDPRALIAALGGDE